MPGGMYERKPKMSKPVKPEKRIIHKLRFGDKMKLVDWLKEHKASIETYGMTKHQVCEAVKEQLRYDITPPMLYDTGLAAGIVWPKTPRQTKVAGQFKTLVLAVSELYDQLAVNKSIDFAQLVREAKNADQ